MFEEYIRKRVSEISSLFIIPDGDLPPPDPDGISAFCLEFMKRGTPAFRIIYLMTLVSLEGICLIKTGKRLGRLDPREGEEFVRSLYRSRWAPIRSIPLLAGLPVFFSHYDREEVQKALGYDVEQLRREAALREVTR
ncbi:MAG: hypothetical protein WHT46_09160 [Candidatus Geothermincolales bacterium]